MTQAPGMFRRWMSFVAWVALAGCSQEAPQYPDQALLLCESASDCPTDWECLLCPEGTEGCEADQSICAPVFDNVCGTADEPGACCGNGNREAWEACDDGAGDTDVCDQGQRATRPAMAMPRIVAMAVPPIVKMRRRYRQQRWL